MTGYGRHMPPMPPFFFNPTDPTTAAIFRDRAAMFGLSAAAAASLGTLAPPPPPSHSSHMHSHHSPHHPGQSHPSHGSHSLGNYFISLSPLQTLSYSRNQGKLLTTSLSLSFFLFFSFSFYFLSITRPIVNDGTVFTYPPLGCF